MALKLNPITGQFDLVTDVISVLSISSNTSALAGKTYLVDSTGGTVAVTLPLPVLNSYVIVKDAGAAAETNNITVARNTSDTIDGATTYVISSNRGAAMFVADGTNWSVV